MITIFESINTTDKPITLTVDKALNRIKAGKHKELISQIQAATAEGDKTKKDKLKKKLPIYLFSGEFNKRAKSGCVSHSGYIVLDFDNLKSVDYTIAELKKKNYIYAVWKSPSGVGVKALAHVEADKNKHEANYDALHKSLKYLGLDTSGRDISRACFDCYDPDIWINKGAAKFEIPREYDVLAKVVEKVLNALNGEKHTELLKAAKWAGGFVAGGFISEMDAFERLVDAIRDKNPADLNGAKKTIRDGLKEGMKLPIYDMKAACPEYEDSILDKHPNLSFLADDDFSMFDDYVSGRLKLGLDTGYKELDNAFRFKEGKFNIVLGHSNVGKSTVIWFMMALSNVRHGWKWIVYSQENDAWTIRMKLMEFYCGKMAKQMTEEDMKLSKAWVLENFKIIEVDDMLSYKTLLELTEETLKMDDFKAVLIDPYNSLDYDFSDFDGRVSTHDYHYKVASVFKQWSKVNNCTIFLNAHAVTSGTRRTHQTGELAGYPMPPLATEIEGGGKFVNKADDFIVVHRYIQHEELMAVTEWHQVKVKETWSGGSPTSKDYPVKLILNNENNFITFRSDFHEAPLEDHYNQIKRDKKHDNESIASDSIFNHRNTSIFDEGDEV